MSSALNKRCDVLIVGGGIAGSGIARDLALRGIDTILVEKDDFGSGTTGKSSRLIHGGLRYLEHLELGLVREGLREREVLMDIAPNLVKPLRFVMPMYKDSKPGRSMLKAAMVVYDALSFDKSLTNHVFVSREETRDLLPFISENGLKGAFVYYDAQAEMVERLCLANVLDAEAHGASIYNHSAVSRLGVDGGKISSAKIEGLDGAFAVDAKIFINATGPWLDQFLAGIVGIGGNALTTTKGVHIITDGSADSALVFNAGDGRPLFVIPWLGRLLIGTTDTMYEGSPDAVSAERDDISYILSALKRYTPGILAKELDVYAGLRPLVRKGGRSVSDISRNYRIIDHDSGSIGNLISVAGSKITEYRSMSEKVGDLVAKKLGSRTRSSTSQLQLPGSGEADARPAHVAREEYSNLVRIYGSDASKVIRAMEIDGKLAARICNHNPDVLAEVYFSVKSEHARTVSDFMLRRSSLGYSACHGLDGLDKVAGLMGELLHWDTTRMEMEKGAYRDYISLNAALRRT